MGQRLGQHFLKDQKVLSRIAREALLTYRQRPTADGSIIIELGPGHGELTDVLLTEGAEKIIAIEKDRELVVRLQKKYMKNGRVEVVEGDIRTVLPRLIEDRKLPTAGYAIIGNIPYYLTGYLLRALSELPSMPRVIAFLVQKEVAVRATAEAPHMNLLSAMIGGWATPRVAFTIPRTAFSPHPKVDSAFLIIEPEKNGTAEVCSGYFETVRKIFRQPRKTLANNIREGFSVPRERAEEFVKALGLKENARASELTTGHIETLTRLMGQMVQ